MNLPASGFLQRFGSLTWRKKKSNVLYGSGLVSPGSTIVDTHWSLGQLNRPVDSVSDLKDERPKSCYVEALFPDSALESADLCPKDNQNIQRNLEMSKSFDCLEDDGTFSYCSIEVDARDTDAQLQSFRASNEKEETNEKVCLPFWVQSMLNEYIPEYHKPQPSPVLKKQGDAEEEKCLHSELTCNTLQVKMIEEQTNSVPRSPSNSDKPLEPNQYSLTHPKCPSFPNDEQDTPQLNPTYPAVQEDKLAQKVTEAFTVSSMESPKLHVKDQFQTQATPGTHKVRYEIIITMTKKGQMDETDVPELGGAMSIGEELVGPDLNLSPSLECQACGHHRAGAAALTAQAHTEQPKKYTNLEDEKNSEQKRGGETFVRAHLDRDISLARNEEQHLLVCEQTLEYHRSQSSKMERKCSLNEHSHGPERAQPSRMLLSKNQVSRVPTIRDKESYAGHVMDMRKVFESNGSKEDFTHKLNSVKSNSYNSVTKNKSTITQNELNELHKPIYSQVFKPPKPSLNRKGCNELLSHLARKDSVNAAQAWESRKEMDSRTVLEKEIIHLRDRDVKDKETKHKDTILMLKDLIVHPRTPTPPPDKSRTTSVLLTSPKGWRKESHRSQSPRPLHFQTDGNMDSAKPVLNESSDKFTFTSQKDGCQNYVTDSFSENTAEPSGKMQGSTKGINNVLITNLQITNKAQSEKLTTIYKLSEKQMRDTGGSEEVILKSAEQESPVQDPARIFWRSTEYPKITDGQYVPTKSNTIIRGVSDDCYEQSNIYNSDKSVTTENRKVSTFGNTEIRSLTLDFPAYSCHWPTSTVLENIHTDNMNDNVYNMWHKAEAQMVYTSTEDESEQNTQDKSISEFWTKAGNRIISHPEVKDYETANETEQDCELGFVISTEDGQSGENRKQTVDGTAGTDGTGDIQVYIDTKDALVEQDNDQTDFLQKPEELVGQTDDAIDILTCVTQNELVLAPSKDVFLPQTTSQPSKEFIHLYTNSEIDIMSEKEAQADLNMNNKDKTHQAGELFQIFSKEISVASDQVETYLEKIDDSIDMIYTTPSAEDQAENMSGLLALDEVGDVLVYISTKEESVEQDNHKAITDGSQKLEQLVDQTDNATNILTLKKETDKNISNCESDKKDQIFHYICPLDVSEERAFIQSKEYLIQKPLDEIDPTVNVIDELLEENPKEHDSSLKDQETVNIHTYRKGKSIENTNEKPSSDIIQKPVDQENHVASPTDSSSKGVQAEHIINLTAEDIKSQSNHSQNVISFASFNETSVEHNKYEPVGIDQGEDVINQSNGRISIVPTDEQHTKIPVKQVDFITMKPKVGHYSENSSLAVKNDMQEMADKSRSYYVTNGRGLLTQEAQVEKTNPISFISSLSLSGQIFSEINSYQEVYQESMQDADTKTSGHTNIENTMSPDVLECSNTKVLTNLPEQSVQLIQGSHVYCTVPVRNDITTEYAGDQYNLQTEEESSKDMEMWINTLRQLEIPEFMKYQRAPRQPRHSALSMYATLPPITEDVCAPNSDQIDSISPPQEKNDDLGIKQDTKTIQNEKKYSWEKNLEKPLQSSPLEMMRKHSGEEVERMASHKSLLTQNLSQRQGSIIGSLLLSDRQERKNEQTEGKSFSRLKSSLLLSSYIKPTKESLSVNGEEAESLPDLVHTEAGSTQFLPNVDVPRTPENPKHPATGIHTPPKYADTVDSVNPLVSRELPCRSNLRTVSQCKASTDIWHDTKKEHGKVNPRPGKVLLYSDPGFSGKCYEIYGNVSDTSKWELKETISIRVIRGGWILYEEPRFHGRRVMLLEGDAELKCPWLEQTDLKGEPQSTSAFWVGSLRHVVRDFQVPKISLFLKPNGEGEKVQIEGAAPDMSEYGQTIKTESIIVHCGMWLVFSKPLFQGDPYILEPGGYPNRRSWGAEDPQVCSLEAARIGGPTVEKPNEPKLLLFQMPESEGTCLEVTRDMNSIEGESNFQGEQLHSMGSLKVVGGCWVGYEKEGFRGHQYLLEEGEYNNFSDWGGCTEELGSVRLIRTDFSQPEIVLYELPGCLEGPCLRLSESLADLEEAQYGTRTGSIHVLSGVWVAYENVDFSGEQYILEKGIYHNHQDWGAENCKISSVQPVIQVGGNSLHFVAKIHLFTEPNFYGDCLTCREDHIELPESFSPQSCRVECGSWSLYEGENCSGEQYILSEGEYPTRTAMGCLIPCSLRSLKIVPLYFSIPSISLHGLERFEGKELDFTEEVRSLQGEGYNNHVMSVSVKSGIWVVYEHSDFRGRQWLLERKQIPNWLLYSGLQRIGSLCPIRQRTVYFRLRNRNLGLFLCVAELTEDMKAARVLVTEAQEGRCLLWFYEEGRLKNQMAPHMSLQVIGQSCSGTKVVLWSESRKPIQTWILEDSGCITSCLFKGMCLDVKGGQCYDSDHVVLWENTEDRPSQQWDLEVF
ncbi:hypothetical protein XELAEV_18015059mg [Xenopus laevis]|uniref:Beta/gamma crystallin 'Greek key' domain-containing protein n=1 Tax=Xenopus laevis TaxID=8355 RepID=A0A974DJJ2_XENLA|nr:hypothetical protein XELAEV_18015059mg [Xenopus laevis]